MSHNVSFVTLMRSLILESLCFIVFESKSYRCQICYMDGIRMCWKIFGFIHWIRFFCLLYFWYSYSHGRSTVDCTQIINHDVETTDVIEESSNIVNDSKVTEKKENNVVDDFIDIILDILRDVSISFIVLMLFAPIWLNPVIKYYHPCYVEELKFYIPKSVWINSMINSLSDYPFRFTSEDFNKFGIASIG